MLLQIKFDFPDHLFAGSRSKEAMNNLEDILQVIYVGLIVATFLVNTDRGLKAIEVSKECLIFVNKKLPKKEYKVFNLVNIAIYSTLCKVYCLVTDYTNATKYAWKLLDIHRECGETAQEGDITLTLASMYEKQFKYAEARELYKSATKIMSEMKNRNGEALSYGKCALMSYCLSDYGKAKENFEKALAIRVQIGDRKGEAADYGNLGAVFKSLGEYEKAKEYLEKALAIRIKIGDRAGQAAGYGNLGAVFKSLGEYEKAKQYLEKALAIRMKIGDRAGQAADYGNLGAVFQCLGEYEKAKEYFEKVLAISIEIGDRKGEATDYGNLGNVFISLGEYVKARKYFEKALAIIREIGHRRGEAAVYGNLGIVFQSLGEYEKAHVYLEKAVDIKTKVGDRAGQARDYGNLGTLFYSLGQYDRSKDYFEKALAISREIGDRAAEAADYRNLGTVFQSLGEWGIAKEYFEKALSISRDIGSLDGEIRCLCNLAVVEIFQGKIQEGYDYLLLSMHKSESLRGFLRDNDQFKISFSDVHDFPYQSLSLMYCFSGDSNKALYVLELARARALADLMTSQYSVKWEMSANPSSWFGIENIMTKESDCSCLYIWCYNQLVFLWILKTSGAIYFRTIRVAENNAGVRSLGSLDEFLVKSFRSFDISPEEDCEDRALNAIDRGSSSRSENGLPSSRQENGDERSEHPGSPLCLFYRVLIAPVADWLKEREIIIVPDRSLNQVPFAALIDEDGKYLSETFRIRIVPSLTTLKLIQDSPAEYHYQKGALIVGDPDVGRVRYKGKKMKLSRLPCAGNEAVMIGRLLGVQPLLGQDATKQAVLERLPSVGLVHFAAHGNAERGEIALSPVRSTNGIPKEEDYLLTMPDIAQVQLRAKLVVLSCCHSVRGQIRAEGVIGIARAFLGSGARSVLVALWAISDRATEQLMCCFYEHLARGESASESLHQTMKWMRDNGFAKVSEWAPFMLIGDDVTFGFGKQEK